jgi:hypothetical protein
MRDPYLLIDQQGMVRDIINTNAYNNGQYQEASEDQNICVLSYLSENGGDWRSRYGKYPYLHVDDYNSEEYYIRYFIKDINHLCVQFYEGGIPQGHLMHDILKCKSMVIDIGNGYIFKFLAFQECQISDVDITRARYIWYRLINAGFEVSI